MSISAENYGKLPTGETVRQFTLANSQGLCLKAINYGGTITELHAPDRQGQTKDVVLGLNSIEEYLDGHPYFGAIVGRVAGRITGARFALDGKEYRLASNDSPNHLHGGLDALDKKLWAAETGEDADGDPCLTLAYTSPDGEEGYPGNVSIAVTYALTQQNELRIEYAATTDQATPLNMTNHSYFNLAGEGSGSIESHLLQIHTDKYVPADHNLTLSGKVASVAGEDIDFTKEKSMGDIIGEPLEIHGDNYMIRRDNNHDIVPVATVVEPASGRVMDVSSSESCLQFYTGKFLGDDPLKGKSGTIYPAYGGLCLECHGYPDGVNKPEIDDIILRPGETYRQTTVYRFSIDQNQT